MHTIKSLSKNTMLEGVDVSQIVNEAIEDEEGGQTHLRAAVYGWLAEDHEDADITEEMIVSTVATINDILHKLLTQ